VVLNSAASQALFPHTENTEFEEEKKTREDSKSSSSHLIHLLNYFTGESKKKGNILTLLKNPRSKEHTSVTIFLFLNKSSFRDKKKGKRDENEMKQNRVPKEFGQR